MTLWIVLAGCQVAPEPATPTTLVDQLLEVRHHMHQRFAASRALHAAISLGDLDRAHAEARLIADLDEPRVLPEWRPYVDGIRGAAAEIAKTGDTVAAARTFAALGLRCAACHRAVPAARPVFPAIGDPAGTPKLPAQMASHQWAAERLWEGLIGPSDERWRRGARELAGARVTIAADGGPLGIADDMARVQLLARRATKLDAPDARAALYGDLLATCAHCHFAIRDR